ncbi:MAG: type II toxin-antitoxin system VapC family toxin [Candidatus Latescibacterota bacterium]|nr:type II toxin-antitoxin system VapC family toxin [Candidatus Latescibacterota bacterium]
MILVDTSVWVRHLREDDRQLSLSLDEGEVAARPWVIGELACGRFEPRDDILAQVYALPHTETLTDDEFFRFLDAHHLVGCGLGFVDVHLLGAARLERISLWTHDLSLCRAADGMVLGYLP